MVARKASPLIIGLGRGEFCGLGYSGHSQLYPGDLYHGGWGNGGGYREKGQGQPTSTGGSQEARFHVDVGRRAAEKGGYEDFMLKEIHEQPRAVRDTLAGKIDRRPKVSLPELKLRTEYMQGIQKIHVVACGTAYHAGLVGKYLLEKLLRIPVEVDLASEFRYRDPIVSPDSLTMIISQSGETADTLAGLREAKERGSRVLAITNVVGSSVAREADDLILTLAGPEIAVASTKAYTTQLLSLYFLGSIWPQQQGTMADDRRRNALVDALLELPKQIEKVLNTETKIKEFAEDFQEQRGYLLYRPGSGLRRVAGRRPEAEGDLLYSRRGLCRRVS